MITELTDRAKVVGAKQTRRAIESGRARRVFLAADADSRVTGPLAQLCGEKGIPTERERSMEEIGRACGIAVGCAAAAVVD